MTLNSKSKRKRLRVCRVVDVPLREVSEIFMHRSRNHRTSPIAVGDRLAKLAWFVEPRNDADDINWLCTSGKICLLPTTPMWLAGVL